MSAKKPTKPKKISNEKSDKKKLLNPTSKLMAIGLIILIGLFIAGFYTIDALKFKSVSNEIDGYMQNLASVRKPTVRSNEKGCYYTSEKYSKGTRYCYASSGLDYNNLSNDEINNIINSANKLKPDLPWARSLDNTTAVREYSNPNIIKSEVFKRFGLSCTIQFSYKTGDDKKEKLTFNDRPILVVAANCIGDAKLEHFPVRK